MLSCRRAGSSAWFWWCPCGGVEVLASPHSHHGILPAAEMHQKAGRNKSRVAPCSRLGCCLLCGCDAALSPGQADPPSSITFTLNPFEDFGSSLSFFIKEGISLSGLPLAPWWFLPACMLCQALAGLGLINSSSAPGMEIRGGCCSRAKCRDLVARASGFFLAHVSAMAQPRPSLENPLCHCWICFWSKVYLLHDRLAFPPNSTWDWKIPLENEI